MRYLEELANTLQLDGETLEEGVDVKDVITAKCELLVNNEVREDHEILLPDWLITSHIT